MFDFLRVFDFLRKKKANDGDSPTVEYAAAPGTGIRYSPDLIGILKGDHAKLLELYGRIRHAFNQGDYGTVAALLRDFRYGLQDHLLTEQVRLYIYLERTLERDEVNRKLLHDFRREMDAIGKNVRSALDKYEAIGVDQSLAAGFDKDFEALGAVLGQRIKREENTLYPLYLASH